ncbi:DUF2818 family protein [Pseudoduganella rhizocola]|uniref:DUF2818 family protein n=1 Tax=Pseudoduganella rhizocola TaxID=3382643 RepID=UPI0038B5B4AA
MDVGASSWLVILLGLAAANLPFFNDKVFAAVPWRAGRKPFIVRLLELTALYFVVGGIGLALEARIGTVFPQNWEFYAISYCLFLVFAFPGFVVRYLRKRH